MFFFLALFLLCAIQELLQVEVLRKFKQSLFRGQDGLGKAALFQRMLNLFGELFQAAFLFELCLLSAGEVKELGKFEVVSKLPAQLPGVGNGLLIFPFLEP